MVNNKKPRRSAVTTAVAAIFVAPTITIAHNATTADENYWLAVPAWVAALLLAVVAVRAQLKGDAPVGKSGGTAESADQATTALARAVEEQWQAEAAVRRLNRPAPIDLRWSALAQPAVLTGARGPRAGVTLPPEGGLDGLAAEYRRMRQLVVLGAPGAGKSSFTLLLTLDLLGRRLPGEPVPVLLPLYSWDPEAQYLTTWIAGRLAEDYPGLANPDEFGPDFVQQLVAEGRILPILDGLDEIRSELRSRALDEIDRAMAGGRSFVLTCRTEEYTAARGDQLLPDAATVEIQPVASEDAVAYLSIAYRNDPRWQPVFAQLRDDVDGPLAAALSTPLMVGLAGAAYGRDRSDPAELLDRGRFPDNATIEDHLLDQYLASVYADRPPAPGQRVLGRYPADRAGHWLAFLARTAQADGTHELAWWTLTSVRRSRSQAAAAGLAFAGLVTLLVGGVSTYYLRAWHGGADAGVGWLSGLVCGLCFGAGVWLSFGRRRTAKEQPRPASRRRRLASMVGSRLAVGGVIGLGIAVTQTGLIGADIIRLRMQEGTADLGHRVAVLAAFAVAPAFAAGIMAGIVAGRGRGRPPARIDARLAGRLRRVPGSLAHALVTWSAVTMTLLLSIQICGSLYSILTGERFGMKVHVVPLMVSVLLMFVPLRGLVELMDRPADVVQAVSPAALLRGDRRVAWLRAVSLGAGVAAAAYTAVLPITGMAVAGAAAGLLAGASSTAWARFLMVRSWLALSGELPWRLMTFLADAHSRGVLRQVGAVYRFRHARLEQHIASPDRLPH